jgi:recombination protein RecR
MILPNIGRKTAERFAFSLLQNNPEASVELASAITELRQHILVCAECGQYSERTPCSICADSKRSQSELCVVADGRDIFSLEQTNLYQGRYFVLGGLINPTEGVGLNQLRIKQLQTKLQADGIGEIILALNTNMEGDATALYLSRLLKPLGIKITRLARGLPTGSRLEYADEVTLQNAFANRREV